MKKLLLLGGPVFQKPVVERARAMGLHVGVADISPEAPAAPFADEFFQGSIKDFDAMLEVAYGFKPDAIASGACDTSVVTVAKLCEALGLPGSSVEAALNSTDKVRMIECFARGGSLTRFLLLRGMASSMGSSRAYRTRSSPSRLIARPAGALTS